MSGLLDGKVVVVTGAGRGIGRGHALELGRLGAAVLVNDADAGSTGAEATAEIVAGLIRAAGGTAIADRGDVSDREAVDAMLAAAVDEFGHIDAVVNNAGIQRLGRLTEMPISDLELLLRVHLFGTVNCMQAVVAHWASLGEPPAGTQRSIVNTTSPTALANPRPGLAGYIAAKGAIASLTRAVAKELGESGIRVNAVSPTGTTRMTDFYFGTNVSKEANEYDAFDPQDPSLNAAIVAFLCSDQAKGVTGRVFEIRGGRVTLLTPWVEGPSVQQEARWDPTELGAALAALVPDLAGDL